MADLCVCVWTKGFRKLFESVFIYLSVCCALLIVITINVSKTKIKTAFFIIWWNPNFRLYYKKDPNIYAIHQRETSFFYRMGIENEGEGCMVRAEDGMDYVELGIVERNNILESCLRFLMLSTQAV